MVFRVQLNVLIYGDTRAEYFFIMDEANTIACTVTFF